MADYEITEKPVFSETMTKLETTSKAHADLFNHKFQTLLNNDNALKNQVEGIKQTHQNDTKNVENSISTLQKEKADKAEIPTSLPANGGNADTVDNLHTADLVQNKRRSISAEELNNPNYPNSYFAETENGSQIGLGANWYHILYFSHVNKDGFGAQIAIPLHYDKEVYYRNSEGINWSAWKRFITSDNINSQNVNYASSANYANSANNANHASSCDDAAKLEGRTAAQVLLLGGKHLAGQGPSGGYSFLGDGAEDTGMFSDFDGDLYFKQNDVKWYAAHSDHNHDSVYSKATNIVNGNSSFSISLTGSDAPLKTTGRGAIGFSTYGSVSGEHSMAVGYYIDVPGDYSIGVGRELTVNGDNAISVGNNNNSRGTSSASFGSHTQAVGWCSFVVGKFNTDPATSSLNFNSPFIIGNGSDDANRANIFRVQGGGNVYAKGSYNTGGADYAEYFEWLDRNEESQDRVGYFVTLNGDKIKIANSENDYILGIISAAPSVIGNSYDDQWSDMYLKDEWGRVVYEEVELPEEKDKEGNIIIEARKEMQPKLNPAYNNSKKYIGRSQRREWSAVGMLGQLLVRDDGTCQVDGYCKCGEGGIATAAETGYRVLARVSDNIIRILFK